MWFLDTGYLIALFSSKDAFHAKAVLLRAQAVRESRRLLTTDARALPAEGFTWLGVIPDSGEGALKLISGSISLNPFVIFLKGNSAKTTTMKEGGKIPAPIEIGGMKSSPDWLVASDGKNGMMMRFSILPMKAGYILLSGFANRTVYEQDAFFLIELKPTPVSVTGSIELTSAWTKLGTYSARNGKIIFDETGMWLDQGTEYKQ